MKGTNAQRVAKNTGYLFIRTFLVFLVTLYTSRVILRILGFEDFGLYNVVGSVVVFFSFLQAALNNATYRYLAYELGTGSVERLRHVYAMAINSHLLLALFLFVVLEIGGVWFLNNRLEVAPNRLEAANWVFQFSLFTFCFSIVRTPFNSNIIAHEHMNFYALVSIVEVFLRLGIVFMLVLSPLDKLVTYGALLMLVSIVMLITYMVYCHVTFNDCQYLRHWDSGLLRQFLAYSGWSLSVNMADTTTHQCMSIFFFNILGAVANAALGIANQVIGALNQFLHTFTQAFNPQIIKSYAAGRHDVFMRMIFTTSKISYYLLLLLTVPVVANISFILHLWLGDYPESTPYFVELIMVYSLIDAFQAPLWTSVHATGNIKVHQILMASIKILAIPAIYVALKLGYSGNMALAIWALLNLCCAVVRTLYLKRLIHLDVMDYLREVVVRIIVVTAIAVPVSCITSSWLGSCWLSFICSSLISILSITLMVYAYGLNQQERQLLKTMPVINKLLKNRIFESLCNK